MKTLIKFFYLSTFVFFAITSKPFRLVGIYSQKRFLTIAKEVGLKVSSDKAVWIMNKINSKINELKGFVKSQESFDSTHKVAVSLTDEINKLVQALIDENKNSLIYRCFVRFT